MSSVWGRGGHLPSHGEELRGIDELLKAGDVLSWGGPLLGDPTGT